MPSKKSSVNMKIGQKKKANPQKKVDDSIASSGLGRNTAPAEQSLDGDGRVNGELHSHGEGMVPFAPGGNQTGDPILQHLREQDDHINRLSNTVDELRKTMGEMNEALTQLRDGSQENCLSVTDASSGDKFDLVASVLRENRSKDDQVERLKLKNEVLTLKIRYLEEKYSDNHAGSQSENPDNYFRESIDGPNPPPVKVPLKESDSRVRSNHTPPESNAGEQRQRPEVQVSIPAPRTRQTKRRSTSDVESGTTAAGTETEQLPPKPPAKKPRRSSTKAPAQSSSDQQVPTNRGRPLSTTKTQATTTTTVQENAADPGEKNGNTSHPTLPLRHVSSTSNLSTASTAKEIDNPDPVTAPGSQQRRRSARSATRQSRRPSASPHPEPEQPTIPPSDMSVGEDLLNDPPSKEFQDEQERIRKEKIAARDRLVEMAMQREEAMDMAGGMGHEH